MMQQYMPLHTSYQAAQYLSSAANQYLDTTVTKFLQNDISVTKFLKQSNDIRD